MNRRAGGWEGGGGESAIQMKEHGAIVQHCQAAGSLFRSVQDRFTGQQNVRRSLSAYITGRVSVGQVINSTFALRAVNFSAINSDEPRKQIAESCKKTSGETCSCVKAFYALLRLWNVWIKEKKGFGRTLTRF